jgi:hypothetical protein
MKKTKMICVWAMVVLTWNIGNAQIFPPYHTYASGIAELQGLVAAHPDICKLDSIGFSNRDSVTIYQFKISDNVMVEEDEPGIFFDGGVHADEILGPEIVLNFCTDIVTRYAAGDTLIQRYVNNYEIYAIPFINPEGHQVVEGGDTDWRKNKSDNNHNGILDFHDGVDNNRNYDMGFDLDTTIAGNTPESLEYKGPYAFSESENRAMRDIGIKYKPIIAVDYHSPTYGRSEKVYYNWYWYSYNGGHGMAPDEVSMGNIARGFAGSIINDQGDSSYEARRGLVDKGDFKTYYYGNFGTAAMVCEVSDTTIQDTLLIDPICQRNLVGMYWLLHRAGYARLTGLVTDSINGLPLDAIVTVQQATGPDINPRHTRPSTGRYDRLIDPGTYTMTFEKTGYITKTIAGIAVTNNGPTATNVRLRPVNLPPNSPNLISPANNSTFADSIYLNFDWNDVAGATGYIIEIASDANFANLLQVDSSRTISNFRNTVSFDPGVFYWRVTAYNAYGFSPRSTTWQFTLTGIVYLVGDVNHSGAVNGVDIVYFVNYLKGGPPPPLEINGFYPEADANGNCQVNGIDIIYMVNYFKGGSALIDGHCVR